MLKTPITTINISENKYISSPAQKPPPTKINGEPKPSRNPTNVNGTQPQSPPNM
jgi:hypothetical protein